MATEKKFAHLKPGDTVFVVYQRTIHQQRQNAPIRSEEFQVTRVGKKYGYIKRGWDDEPFDLVTGCSAANKHNERANGQGFDVYLSKEDYKKECDEREAFDKLKERICHRWNGLIPLPPHIVTRIHQLLDGMEHEC